MGLNQLTDTQLRKAKARRREYLLADGEGLFLRVRPDGTKNWLFYFSMDGRQQKRGLGVYPHIDLSAARELAATSRAQVAKGLDPAIVNREARVERGAEQQRHATRPTLKGLFDDWMHRELKTRRKDAGISTQQAFERDVFPLFGARYADSITRRDIQAIMDSVAERGARRSANKIRSELRQMFSWGLYREIIPSDPTAVIRKLEGADKIRERTLSEDEIRELSKKLSDSGLSEGATAAVWIILSTMCRVGELSCARWEEVNYISGVWAVPGSHTKNGREHIIHLSDFAKHQFECIPRDTGCPWIYPGPGGNAPILRQSLQKQFKDRQRLVPLKGRSNKSKILRLKGGEWHSHDLRRTGATLMGELGIRPDVIDRALNHIEKNKVTRIYQRQELLEDRKRAFRLLGKRLEMILTAAVFCIHIYISF
jgi:integrase